MRPNCSFPSLVLVLFAVVLSACGGETPPEPTAAAPESAAVTLPPSYKQAKYATVKLSPALDALNAGERAAVPLIVAALESIDQAFWLQVFGPKVALLDSIPDPDARRFAEINYGPWDRLDQDRPFLPVSPKPATSRFYPLDLQPGELEAAGAASSDGGANLRNPYTVVRRDENKALRATPFHEVYAGPVGDASGLLGRAAEAAGGTMLGRYLELQAKALKSDTYTSSDEAWLKIDGALGVVIGPLDRGEDHIHRLKRSYTGAVWAGRSEWEPRLSRYRSLLPELTGNLLSRDSTGGRPAIEFEVADLIHISGSWNAGPKRFVLELPVDETLRRRTGTRRLLLHNVARAKYDATLVPLAENLILQEQRDHVTFDAFFTNDLLLEMIRAEGTSEEGQTLQRLFGEVAWIVGVARANVIAAHVVGQLAEQGETGSSIEQHYVTLVASAFRSLRFGSASAQGPAALILLNQLKRDGAIVFEAGASTYRVDVEVMRGSVRDLAGRLAVAQDPEKTGELGALLAELSKLDGEWVADLVRLAQARVPIDVAFASPGS